MWTERALRTGNLPKLTNLITLRLIREGLHLFFKWPVRAVTHSDVMQTDHTVFRCMEEWLIRYQISFVSDGFVVEVKIQF